MKKVLPLTFLCFSLPVLAQSNHLDDILNRISLPVSVSVANQCLESDFDLNQCAIALCGTPDKANTAAVNDNNFDLYIVPGIKEKFQALDGPVKKIFEKKKKEDETFIKSFREKLNDGSMLDFAKWDPWAYSNLSSTIYDRYFTKEIDKSKPKDQRLVIRVTPPSDATEIFSKGLSAYAELQSKKIQTSVVDGMYADIYTKEENLELLKDMASKFYSEYEKELKKNPAVLRDDAEIIAKYRDIDSLNINDHYEFGNAYSSLKFLLDKMHGSFTATNFQNDCNGPCEEGIRDYLTKMDLKGKLSEFEKTVNETDLKEALVNCQSELVSKAFKQSEKEKFLAYYPQIKQNFMEKVFTGFSDHSKKAFNDYVDDQLHLSFLKYSPDAPEKFITELEEKAKSEPSELATNSLSLLQKFFQYRDWSDSELFKPEEQCSSQPAFAAWDAFAPKEELFGNDDGEGEGDIDNDKDNVMVSLFTCTHEKEGKGVLSHEMGHVLSYAFLKKKLSVESEHAYMKQRTCATSSYVNPLKGDGDTFNRPGDSLRTEEDMADVVSFMATKEDQSLFTCALLETNKKGDQFINLGLKNRFNMDTHSSPLLRIIREAIYKNKTLPPSCKGIIEGSRDEYRFTPCL